jgi:hypothetical protein
MYFELYIAAALLCPGETIFGRYRALRGWS